MAKHPFLPADIKLVSYVPNSLSAVELLLPFFGATAAVIVVSFLLSKKAKLASCEMFIVSWFFSSGLIHCILEGYFAFNHKVISGQSTFLAQIWKEYGKGDSRYIISDNFTVCMETFTAIVDGAMCLAMVYAYLTRQPWKFPLQILVSSFQLYGCVLYFATEWFDGFKHGPLGHPVYFWFYVVFMNAIWIVIPFFLIVQGFGRISEAVSVASSRKSR